MLIRIKKEEVPILEYTREDGSVTWGKIQPAMVAHDLAHYVVETQLDFRQGFYGLLADGWNIEDFEKPREQRPTELLPINLPHEAIVTEHIVNMLLVSFQSDNGFNQIFVSLKDILAKNGFDLPPKLDLTKFLILRTQLQELLKRWNELPTKNALELNF